MTETVMTGRERLATFVAAGAIPALAALAALAILGLTALGWVLSYSALRRLAEGVGYAGWEANLWPLTVDLLAFASAIFAIIQARRGHGPSGEAWGLAILAGLATIAGNVVAAGALPVGMGPWVRMALHAWPAVCMLGAWHLLVRSIESGERPMGRRDGHKAAGRKAGGNGHRPAPRLATEDTVEVRAVRVAGNGNGHLPGAVEAKASELRASGRAVTGEALASEFGVSERTGRRWLRKLGEGGGR